MILLLYAVTCCLPLLYVLFAWVAGAELNAEVEALLGCSAVVVHMLVCLIGEEGGGLEMLLD